MPGAAHVLIVDDDETLSRALKTVLTAEGHRATVRLTPEGLVDHLDRDRVDLLILDLGLPGTDGFGVLDILKSHPIHRDIPVVVLSASPPGDATVQALGKGATDYIAKPFRLDDLLARIKAHLRTGRALAEARAETRTEAELADIVREMAASLSPAEIYQVLVERIASGLGISRCSIVLDDENGETATVVAAHENPGLRHLTIELRRYPELLGPMVTLQPLLIVNAQSDPVLSQVRELWRLEGRLVPTTSIAAIPFRIKGHRPACFFLRTAGDDHPLEKEDLDFAGKAIAAATIILDKAYDFEEALRRQAEMRQLAETDPLTGLFNRRALKERLENELARAERTSSMVSCLMLDIDHFKQLNDTYGHELGDRVLVQLADLLRREQRSVDILARMGGEEFVVVLPETGLRGARIYAERILRRVSAATFGSGPHPVQITVSLGIATFPDERIGDSDSLLRVADTNLLRAKADGRNRYRD